MVDPLSSIELARQSLSALTAAVRVVFAATVDQKLKDKQIDIQEAILEVQSRLGDALADRLELLDKLGKAQQRVRELEAEVETLAGYELVEVSPGIRYWRKVGAVDGPLACPKCYAKRRLGLVQTEAWGEGSTRYRCSSCDYIEFIEHGPTSSAPKGSTWSRSRNRRI